MHREGSVRRFKVSKRDTFAIHGSTGTVFRSSERQQIIDFLICSKIKDGGAELDDGTELGNYITQKFPLHVNSRLSYIRHCWVTFWKRETPGTLSPPWSPFSVSLSVTLYRIYASMWHCATHLLVQPLDNIAEYFGESVAFYFAYLEFYTQWLILPAICGLIVFFLQVISLLLHLTP